MPNAAVESTSPVSLLKPLGHIPRECHPLLGHYDDKGQLELGTMDGQDGGAWSPARHLCQYGFNWPDALARWLTFQIQPSSVLEFGCGLGLTADYIARYGPNSKVVCIEPNAMLPEVFASRNKQLHQLRVDVTQPATTPDGACGAALAQSKFDLVLTLEVVEHIDSEKASFVLDMLANATGRFLVFAAARPDQGGTGHINLKTRDWYISEFERRGLVHLPLLTKSARAAAYRPRAYDLHFNLLVFTASSEVLDTATENPLVFGQYGENSYLGYDRDPPDKGISEHMRNNGFSFFQHNKNGGQPREVAALAMEWYITSTLWPKTHLMMREREKVCNTKSVRATNTPQGKSPQANLSLPYVPTSASGSYDAKHPTFWADQAWNRVQTQASYDDVMAVPLMQREAKAKEIIEGDSNS